MASYLPSSRARTRLVTALFATLLPAAAFAGDRAPAAIVGLDATGAEATPLGVDARRAPEGRTVRVDAAAIEAGVRAGRLLLPSTDGAPLVARDLELRQRDDGLRVVTGRVDTAAGPQSVVLTLGDGVAFGTIPQREGPALRLETRRGVARLGAGPDAPDLAGFGPDVALPPAPTAAERALRRRQESEAAAPAPKADGDPVIDVVVVYSPTLVQLWGSVDAVHARIAHLEEISNQAYVDSNIGQSIRVVARHMVDYTVNNDNSVALNEITGSAAGSPESLPVRQEVVRLRSQYGADLVKLMRNFDRSTQTSCGIAWLGGWNGGPFTQTRGFSVTSDHGFANDNCGEWTFTHELGHNMGSHHDIDSSGGDHGAYFYSHGHRQTLSETSGFATVMAYNTGPQVRIGRFSDPLVSDCLGTLCGILDMADNVRSLNNTRALVAAITTALPPTALPLLSVSDVSVSEGNSGQTDAKFVISLSHPAITTVNISLATMHGSARSADYVARTASVTIPAGQSSVEFVVKVNGDTDVEVDEYFALNVLSATNARVVDGQGVATIVNDEATPTLSMSDVFIDEGDSGTRNAQFVVSLTNPSSDPVTFDFHTHTYAAGPNAATAGSDFSHAPQAGLVIPAGQTARLVAVPVHGDTVVEQEERFYVMINNVTGAKVGDVFAVGRIRNDDGVSPRPTISVGNATVEEGNTGTRVGKLPVTLSAPAPETVYFTAISNGGTATVGVDYDQLAANLTIPAGQSSGFIDVVVRGDTVDEPDETVTVTLVNVAGAVFGGGAATLQIQDDDAPAPLPLLVPRDDHAVVLENSPGTIIDVLANDVFTAGRLATGSLSVSVAPALGAATVDTRGTTTAADDRIVYVPAADTGGDDRFGYQLCESDGRCVEASVSLVVRPHAGVFLSDDTGAGHADVQLAGLRAMPDARIDAAGLYPSVAVERDLADDPTPETPWDEGRAGTATWFQAVAPGDPFRVLVDARSLDGGDVDVYLGYDDDGDGIADPGEVRCTAATAAELERCEMPPAPGKDTWWVMLHSRDGAQRARFHPFVFRTTAGPGAGGIAATGPGQLPAGESFPVRLLWDSPIQAAGAVGYGMLRIGQEGATPSLVPVRVERGAVSATPRAIHASAPQGPIMLATGGSQDRLYVDVPPGATGLRVRAEGYAGTIDIVARQFATPPSSPAIAPAPAVGTSEVRWDNQSAPFDATLGAPPSGRWYVIVEDPSAGDQPVAVSALVQGEGVGVPRPGSYYNPDRSGHGLLLYPAGSAWAGLWYTYFQDGTATWYYLQGDAPGGNGVWQGGIYRAAWNGTANRLTQVGSATVTSAGPDALTFSYLLDGEAGSEPMQALGRGCPTLGGADLDVSSHWFNPARAGTGYSVQMWPDYEFYAAFVYDALGVPRFLTAESTQFAGADAVIRLDQLHGFCPLCTREGDPQRFDVGNLRRRFAGGSFDRIELDAIWTDGVPGTWTADEAIVPLGGPASMQGCLP